MKIHLCSFPIKIGIGGLDSMYKLYVRDQYLKRVAMIDDYQSLDIVLRFNAPGTWALDLPMDSAAAKEIVNQRTGIIVERNRKVIFSGPVTGRKRHWNNEGDRIVVNGFDDTIWLSRNLAYPVPLGPPYSSKAYDKRTGNAETIMKQYVDVNIGPNARSDRRVTKLEIEADKGIGKSVTGNARFHPLLELNTKLALAGGDLGFRIIQVNSNLEFQVYDPSDKTKEVFFSPLLGNLQSFEYTLDDPETNYAIVGGGGEGTERTFIEGGRTDSISKYGRIETFVDQRDTTETSELQQSLDEELIEKSSKSSLSIVPIDIEGCSFGLDYNLGDKVSIILTQPNEVVDKEIVDYFISLYQTTSEEATSIRKIQDKLEIVQDIVREIKISVNSDGETILPTIGTPGSLGHFFSIFNKMKKLNKRINQLERR